MPEDSTPADPSRQDDLKRKSATTSRLRPSARRGIFAPPRVRPRHFLDSMRHQLILMLVLALAPIAALCFMQGVMLLQIQDEAAQEQVLRGAASAAEQMEDVFSIAESTLAAVIRIPAIREAQPACGELLSAAVAALPFTNNIAVLDDNGDVRCSALPRTPFLAATAPADKSDSQPGSGAFTLLHGGTNVGTIIGYLPFSQPEDGAIVMDINTGWLDSLLKREAMPGEAIVALMASDGTELASNAPTLSRTLFPALPTLESEPRLLEVKDDTGRTWSWTITSLGHDGLMAAFALPAEKLFPRGVLTVATSFALPAFIVVFSLVALWLAVDNLILRWLRYLRRVTTVYAQGHYGFHPTRLKKAPSEFRALGHAVENMASAVRQRDTRLRASLEEKTALVREVHHRIKNSMQLVVSLISLYGAGPGRHDDRRGLEQLRMRINTLALVHRILYEVAEGSQVHLDELLRELAAMLENAMEPPLRIRSDVEDVPVPTDMAVPIALLVEEIVLDLARHSRGQPASFLLQGTLQGRNLHLCLHTDPGVELSAEDIMAEADLAHGFAAQLGGVLSASRDGSLLVVCGDFPCPVPHAARQDPADGVTPAPELSR